MSYLEVKMYISSVFIPTSCFSYYCPIAVDLLTPKVKRHIDYFHNTHFSKLLFILALQNFSIFPIFLSTSQYQTMSNSKFLSTTIKLFVPGSWKKVGRHRKMTDTFFSSFSQYVFEQCLGYAEILFGQ